MIAPSGSKGNWGNRVFAPYLNVWANTAATMNRAFSSSGVKYFTLAFLVSDAVGNAAFDGSIPLTSGFLQNEIKALRSNGGDIIFSFGGATGKEIAITNTNPTILQQRYQAVIDRYQLTWLDFVRLGLLIF